jgi:organic radical activating enzyme
MITETNKNSWCVNAFHGMSANNNGSSKMCCMITSDYNTMQDLQPIYFVDKISIEQNFNNPASIKIREDLNNGIRNSACKSCWEEENAGRKSKRLRDNEIYLKSLELGGKPFNGLAKFELNLGNNCNIKCRTCAPQISSTWMKEDYELNHSKLSYKEYAERMRVFHQSYDDESVFWEDLKNNLVNIRQFDFYGGEPFLSKKMWEILSICVEKDYAKDIELHYNTNGTTWPEDKISMFKHFKGVNLSFSIDGIEEQFEYMRFPAKWNEVLENMNKAKELSQTLKTLKISWCITLSTLNIYDLPKTINFYYDNFPSFGFYLNLVHGPRHYNISTLPTEIKDKIIQHINNVVPKTQHQAWMYLDGILNFIKNGYHEPASFISLKNVTKKHDQYRGQDFNKVFPEYAKIIGI